MKYLLLLVIEKNYNLIFESCEGDVTFYTSLGDLPKDIPLIIKILNLADQIFYCNQRGLSTETAVALIVNGYAKEVLKQLPMEFAVEAQKLLAISLEGSVG